MGPGDRLASGVAAEPRHAEVTRARAAEGPVAGVTGCGPAGKGPEDGFTGYVAYVGNPPWPRWGDYGAASVVGGNVWIASEYIGQS